MDVWQFIRESPEPVALLYVADSKGSSPGRKGFKMAIRPDGEMAGSIGGGVMEQKLVKWAVNRLVSGDHHTAIRRQIHRPGEDRDSSGLICSGEQTVVFTVVHRSDFTFQGFFTLTEQGAAESIAKPQGNFLAVEPFSPEETIYIIGGGHVGLALSRTMSRLDFRVEIFDDRAELNTIQSNTYADKIHPEDLAESLPGIPEGNHSWIAAVTFGIVIDRIVLETLRNRKYRYFGVMGSDAKIRQLKQEFGPLPGITAPIGLSIHSQTPEEIAVSIAAQIIAEKNQNNSMSETSDFATVRLRP
ncbi:MAG: XdhC family protein [Verrucomicrobiales bacterium]|nr:XdhC family protein [Verrucomicrobiales bacterium]